MTSRNSVWEWIGAGSGLLAMVLMLVGFGLIRDYGETLDTSSPSVEIAKFYVDRADQARA